MRLKNRREFIRFINKLNFKAGVEIGVKEGYFSKYILENTNMTVYSIDPWEENAEETNASISTAQITSIEQVKAYETAKNNLNPFGERSIIIRDYSHNAHINFKNESIDFVYIDGLHTYHAVKSDIDDFYPKIKSGGIISGHDYSIERWVGVVNAVNEFVEKNNLTLFIIDANGEYDGNEVSWWFYKK